MKFLKNLFKRKSVDDELARLGFKKVKEHRLFVTYERENTHQYTGTFTHVIDISFRPNGKHWIQSYEKGVNTDGFNNTVALTVYEMELILDKIIEKKWPCRK